MKWSGNQHEGRLNAMAADSAHKASWQIAEVIFGVPLLVAIALQFAFPLSLHQGSFRPASVVLGAALIAAGVAFIILARRAFARHGQPTDPGRPTTQLVTTGVFSISRNPLYLAAAFVLAGIGLTANLPWVWILLMPSLVACHYVLIVPEEKYLAGKFDEEYRRYSRTVSRWLGRRRRTAIGWRR
jgi:protein-S-isoprenylcysteine O-methyltransferase Ste14